MKVDPAAVTAVIASGDANAVDALFRQALADRVPEGLAQPRWSTGRQLQGRFEGFGAVADFKAWCDWVGSDPVFEFGPPFAVVLCCDFQAAGYPVQVTCHADQSEVEEFFRLDPGWEID